MKFDSGSEDKLILRNGNFSGLNFNHFLTAATSGAALTTPTVDWSEIHVTAKLFQDGLTETIYNGKLYPLLKAATLRTAEQELINENSSTHANITRLANATGVKQLANMGVKWYWGETINLRGGDKIEVAIDMDSNVYHATADSTASYLDCDGINGVGLQKTIPKWNTEPINSTEENPAWDLGNNITMISVVNLDKTSILDAAAIIDKVTLTSDRLKEKRNYEDLLQERVGRYSTLAQSTDRQQSFELFNSADGTAELDKVKLELDVNVSAITTSKNYVVTRAFVTHSKIIKRAQVRNQKHQVQAQTKVARATR